MAKYYITQPATWKTRTHDYTEYLKDYDHLSTTWTTKESYPMLLTLEQVIEVIKLMDRSQPLYPTYTVEIASE